LFIGITDFLENSYRGKMRGFKRRNRKQRWRSRFEKWAKLDEIALKKIKASYMASACSWGGNRCPGCGIDVRPSWIVPWVMRGPGMIMHGQTFACDSIGRSQVKCPGERDWDC
jgi:hypothetical protein